MNFKLSSLVLILGLNIISCYVKNDNSSEVTTKLSLESSKSMVTKGVNNEKENLTEVVNQKSRVYLDDVLFMLRNHEWGAEEQPCLQHIQRLLYNLQNFTLWAVWDWDSQASEPQGILSGNQYQLGNFDQCMKPPWAKTYPEFRTKYCLAQIKLERTDKAPRRRVIKPHNPYQSALDFIEYRPPHSRPLNELTWGACVPAECGLRTVERLFGVMLAHSHLGTAGMRANISIVEPCQSTGEQQEFDGLFYAFVGVAAFLILISVVCTCINSQDKELSPNNTKTELIQAFCIKRNASDLLKMRKDGVEVLYGIRILTICLIVLDHQIGISNAGPISDGVRFDEEVVSLLGHFIVHDDLFVDTFFFLSGFLTMTTLLRFKKLPNPLILILRRYVRMVVAFALTVFYLAAVFPYTGSGPLWRRVTEYEAGSCRDNWWLNVLMLSNYVHTDNMCLVVSWYIPCDFHFFVVTIFAYCLYKKFPRLGAVVAVLLAIGSIIIPAIIHYAYQLPAVQLFTFDFVSNPRASEQFKLSYITSHTRYAAYLVGFYSGYLFVKHTNNGNFSKIKQKWSVLGTCSSLVVMLGVMVLGSTFLWRSYHPVEGAVYAALNRPVWATGIAALVLCCSLGHVPLVKSFLSWYPWVPLSRLAYGLYLTHSIIITRNVFVTRNPQHNDYFDILNAAVGVIFWGCVASLLLWLFAEAPANKLLSICLKFNVQTNIDKESAKRASEPNPTSTCASMSSDPAGNNGHLHDNLPGPPPTRYFLHPRSATQLLFGSLIPRPIANPRTLPSRSDRLLSRFPVAGCSNRALHHAHYRCQSPRYRVNPIHSNFRCSVLN